MRSLLRGGELPCPLEDIKLPVAPSAKSRILVLREKHGDRYFAASDDHQLGRASVEILRSRVDRGCFYFDEDLLHARSILDTEDMRGKRAWRFLNSRSRHEYEGVELEHLEVL